MKNLPLLIGTILATLVLIVGVAIFFSGQSPTGSGQVYSAEQLIAADSHVMGAETAGVTIVEFSDFQCPACQASQPFVQQVLAEYPENVRLVFRHFPLDSIHPFARIAAQAAEAAGELGGEQSFWAFHDVLFERQSAWSNLESVDAVRDTLASYATEMELDKDEFLARMEETVVVAKVAEDAAAAKQLNLGGTPTFFVNGRQTPAQQLLDAVATALTD